MMQNLCGQTLGQYQIIEQIGAGGMATVFKAYQPGLKRDVALKILPPYIAQKEGFTERFNREAEAIGNLHHPNILPVYDSGQDKGYGYIAMRYIVKASTLADQMKQPFQPEQIIKVMNQLANALDHAHQAGIIHRDIKPSNILMDGDWVLLSDFGLAKMMESPSELTGSGVGLGTPAYMSPEQAKAEPVDHRTDIYALGVILFEMLTGQVPHKAETPLAIILKKINEPLPQPRSLNPDISLAVEKVLLKALAVEPNQRYDSAGELAQALQIALADELAQDLTLVSKDVALANSLPLDQATSQSAQPADIDATGAKETQPASSKSPSGVEIVLMTVLGLMAVGGIIGVLLSFVPNTNPGESSIAMAPACMGLTFAGFTSILMIWRRNRAGPASAWLAIGILAWFLGINILGWGGFAALSPGETSFGANLGFSLALCFTPGGILALLGLGMFIRDYRRSHRFEEERDRLDLSSEKDRREAKIKRAADYRLHITNMIKQHKGSAYAEQLIPIVAKLERWETHLRQLVNRLDTFEANRIIRRDLREVPAAIDKLQAELKTETNPAVRVEIEETLAKYRAHQRQLDSLVTMMRRTELDIDETVAAIGALYSQLQLLGAKDIDSNRARRLSGEVEEQVNRLGDLLAAMEEVYNRSSVR
jgi:serine/threonine protein kinase